MSGESIGFDRAASLYDHTRQFSSEKSAKRVMEMLTSELEGRGRCLEIGVGTGRIAIPATEAGIELIGVDLSRPMLERLVEKSGGMPFPLAVADATKLPFRDGAFGATYGVHVLHLIPNWRVVVQELVRVVRPGGVVLLDFGGPKTGDDVIEEVSEHFEVEAGIEQRHPGIQEEDTPALDQAFDDLGARLRLLPPVMEERLLPIEGWLQLMRDNVFSWTWQLDDVTRDRAVDATLVWARERFGDVTTPRPQQQAAQWRVYELR